MLHMVKNRVQTNWRGNSWKPFQIWLNQWYGHVDRMVQFANAIIRTNIIASEFDCESGLACIFALSVGNIFWLCKWKIMERRKSSKWRWGFQRDKIYTSSQFSIELWWAFISLPVFSFVIVVGPVAHTSVVHKKKKKGLLQKPHKQIVVPVSFSHSLDFLASYPM